MELKSWADQSEEESEISDEDFVSRISKVRFGEDMSFKTNTEKQCFKCGNLNSLYFSETKYGSFQPICKKCSEWNDQKRKNINPSKKFFLVSCDICKSRENVGMLMMKPYLYIHRCEKCCN